MREASNSSVEKKDLETWFSGCNNDGQLGLRRGFDGLAHGGVQSAFLGMVTHEFTSRLKVCEAEYG